jgi:Ca2+-binding RTX toxin-like protein
MSIRKGKLRRSAVVVAFTVGAFQALSVIGANVASAAVASCSFTSGVLTIGVTGSPNVIGQDAAKNIEVGGFDTDTFAGCTTSAAANVGNTTAINVTGPAGVSLTNESVQINKFLAAASISWGTINWTVNLGDEATPAGDTFIVSNGTNLDDGVKTDWGVNGVDLNGDGDLDVVLADVETSTHITGIGTIDLAGDTVNAGGSTITGAAYPLGITINGAAGVGDQVLTGGAGGDSIIGGAGSNTLAGGLGNDTFDGTLGDDTVDYSASATAVVVNLGPPGVGSGEGLDALVAIENLTGSDHGDSLTGDVNPNWLAAGDGNDTIVGGAGGGDTYDAAGAEEAVTVDLGAGTSTGGSGTDTLSGIEDASGSAFDDSLTGSSGANVLYGEDGNDTLSGGAGNLDGADSFDGGSGIDTLDYGKNTSATTVALFGTNATALCTGPFASTDTCSVGNGVSGAADVILTNSVENAILGTGNDVFTGSSFNNTVWPNGGQNSLNGCPNAVLGCGIDTVNYSTGYTAGVTVNLAGGGPSGGNADSIVGFTNAVGTAFADDMIGTDLNIGNSLKGGKGNDTISGNNGPDFVLGGAGNDRIRGGNGDDSLKGQGGKDNIRGSGGADDLFGGKGKDFCLGGGGNDLIKTCEKPRHNGHGPNGNGLHQRI